MFRVALPTISIHCCWLKNKRKIQIGSHITAIQPTLFCSLMLGVHMVAVKGSLVLFTGPCQPVNGQLSLLLPALTMVRTLRVVDRILGSLVLIWLTARKKKTSLFFSFSRVFFGSHTRRGFKDCSAARISAFNCVADLLNAAGTPDSLLIRHLVSTVCRSAETLQILFAR